MAAALAFAKGLFKAWAASILFALWSGLCALMGGGFFYLSLIGALEAQGIRL